MCNEMIIEQRRNELEMVLNWRISPKLELESQYRVTIAYTGDDGKENIKVLGIYPGTQVSSKILRFFDKFLQDVNSFGLLVESQENDEVKNWDISFSKTKKEKENETK